MPVYEFYCKGCNTVYSFISKRVNTEKVPGCPKCRGPLKRMISLFATPSGREEEAGGEAGVPGLDEAKMEKAMAALAGEAEEMREDDPRQAATLMRKLSEMTGLNMGPKMEDALSRLERGEDPEKIEEEMGDLLEGEEPFSFETNGKTRSRRPPPAVDDTLYEM
jgi:putative FmdB family regulatory protein